MTMDLVQIVRTNKRVVIWVCFFGLLFLALWIHRTLFTLGTRVTRLFAGRAYLLVSWFNGDATVHSFAWTVPSLSATLLFSSFDMLLQF